MKNPFVDKEFVENWLKSFANTKKPQYFESIGPLGFIKSRVPSTFINIGKNITNGLQYSLSANNDFKGKVFLIYDVTSYEKDSGNEKVADIGVKKIKQYKGYLSRLTHFIDHEDFLTKHNSSSTRMKLRKNERKLNTNFDVEYEVIFGFIDRVRYDKIMDRVFTLIESRFKSLKLDNDILHKKEYYRQLFYDMIIEKKAVIHMICYNEEAIAVSLSFLSENELFYAINTFDTRFRRYNLGHISILNMIKWCFENNIKILDYSKGTYDYKSRWANESYFFENHIVYDKRSFWCCTIAMLMEHYFRFKQFLRDKNLNEFYVRAKFFLSFKQEGNINNYIPDDEIMELEENEIELGQYQEMSQVELFQSPIAGKVYDLLYSKPQDLSKITVMKKKEEEEFLIMGNGINKKIVRL